MAYIFYTVSALIAAFLLAEAVNVFKGRRWGENR